MGAVADAPPATAKETPAAPNTGKLVFARFRLEGCFACVMKEHSCREKMLLFKRGEPDLVPSPVAEP